MEKSLIKPATILSDIRFDISFQEVADKIHTSRKSDDLQKTIQHVLMSIAGVWKPVALYRWFDFKWHDKKICISLSSRRSIDLNVGCAHTFLRPASQLMICLYTIGNLLDEASAAAASKGDLLEAYIIDQIGLIALSKTEDILKKIVQEKAQAAGYGVSPILSPGSVHGWELEEQTQLIKLLPTGKIAVSLMESGVLYPLKSVSAIIGIGPGYHSTTAGSACEICARRNNCQMKLDAV